MYIPAHTFSPAQARHALSIVIALMRVKRFFLYREDAHDSVYGELGHGLDPAIFGPAIELDEDIRRVYALATKRAEHTIINSEHRLGVKAPDLDRNQRLVQCNRYTGGLDICRVYPLTAFTEFAPAELEELRAQELKRQMGDKTINDFSPKDMHTLGERVYESTSKIWEELQAIKALAADNACVVLLKTRFEPTYDSERGEFLRGKLSDLTLFPHAMGYLFYEYSKRTRIVRHSHVVFNFSQKAHVNVEHWSDGKLSLHFDKTGGYGCKVYIPIVW